MNVQTNSKKGFTIIEVVLVLAIAGLIFLMIFIAWPALQRGQRDTQRRSDVGRFVSQLSSYATNNNGKAPKTAAELTTFKTNYLKWNAGTTGEFNDPTSRVGYVITASTVPPTTTGAISYATSAAGGYGCNGESFVTTTSVRQVAVMVKLEGSGFFCQTNL